MMSEFLFPYYQQLLANIKARQIDRSRHLYVQVDTDGFADAVIPLYREAIGMDVMSPFEVAAGCDVVRTGRRVPGSGDLRRHRQARAGAGPRRRSTRCWSASSR